jgi:hypothetical protein
MRSFKRGDIIEHDGLLAVVVGTDADGGAPEDQLALWYGEPRCIRISKGGVGGQHPEVWTVPSEYCTLAASSVVRH